MEVVEKAAAFMRKNLYNEQPRKLQHSFRNGPSKAPGFLDDYAFMISALLDLYEFGSSLSWLSWAIQLQHIHDDPFLNKEGGGYFNTPGEDPSVLLRLEEDHDGAQPSGNAVSVINLVRLALLVVSGSDHYRHNAERLLYFTTKKERERNETMSQNEKLMPNLDEKSTKLLNLTVLQRIDPFVEEILNPVAHITFYEFNIDTSQ